MVITNFDLMLEAHKSTTGVRNNEERGVREDEYILHKGKGAKRFAVKIEPNGDTKSCRDAGGVYISPAGSGVFK